MGWEDMRSNWDRYKVTVREKWSFLSEDEINEIAGDRNRLIEKIEARYGLSRSRAEHWVDEQLGAEIGKAA